MPQAEATSQQPPPGFRWAPTAAGEQPCLEPIDHIAGRQCWCNPSQLADEPSVFLHNGTEMPDYQPAPHAARQGDDAAQWIDPYYYAREHDGSGWSVRGPGDFCLKFADRPMDKNVAYIIAKLLSDKPADALMLLRDVAQFLPTAAARSNAG